MIVKAKRDITVEHTALTSIILRGPFRIMCRPRQGLPRMCFMSPERLLQCTLGVLVLLN